MDSRTDRQRVRRVADRNDLRLQKRGESYRLVRMVDESIVFAEGNGFGKTLAECEAFLNDRKDN